MVQPVPQSPRESALTEKLRPGGSVGMGGRRAGTGSNRPSVHGVGRPVVRLRRQWLKEWIRHGWKERFVCRSQDGSRGSGTAAVPGRPWAGIHQPVMGAQLMHGRLAAALQCSGWGPDPRECGAHHQTRGSVGVGPLKGCVGDQALILMRLVLLACWSCPAPSRSHKLGRLLPKNSSYISNPQHLDRPA